MSWAAFDHRNGAVFPVTAVRERRSCSDGSRQSQPQQPTLHDKVSPRTVKPPSWLGPRVASRRREVFDTPSFGGLVVAKSRETSLVMVSTARHVYCLLVRRLLRHLDWVDGTRRAYPIRSFHPERCGTHTRTGPAYFSLSHRLTVWWRAQLPVDGTRGAADLPFNGARGSLAGITGKKTRNCDCCSCCNGPAILLTNPHRLVPLQQLQQSQTALQWLLGSQLAEAKTSLLRKTRATSFTKSLSSRSRDSFGTPQRPRATIHPDQRLIPRPATLATPSRRPRAEINEGRKNVIVSTLDKEPRLLLPRRPGRRRCPRFPRSRTPPSRPAHGGEDAAVPAVATAHCCLLPRRPARVQAHPRRHGSQKRILPPRLASCFRKDRRSVAEAEPPPANQARRQQWSGAPSDIRSHITPATEVPAAERRSAAEAELPAADEANDNGEAEKAAIINPSDVNRTTGKLAMGDSMDHRHHDSDQRRAPPSPRLPALSLAARLEWQGMLEAALAGDVVRHEKKRLIGATVQEHGNRHIRRVVRSSASRHAAQSSGWAYTSPLPQPPSPQVPALSLWCLW
ncbi:hypothetical protein MAPG_10600 [Magnaporthiopsis poae ATCC 64411]|uniref:Uncharacterized protein n=1 Tax=Magnaporthiopsis poae (strain ATCC 64411 / 73-15) TaxID=644358 RepID=A0A0C4ED09_MAGP6|nr:hypothetical protein MAPG_10600 [Magnaporthiopsis poae ATCC 64411]